MNLRGTMPLLVAVEGDEVWFVVVCPHCRDEVCRFRSPNIINSVGHKCKHARRKTRPRDYFKEMIDRGIIWSDGSYRGGPHIKAKR